MINLRLLSFKAIFDHYCFSVKRVTILVLFFFISKGLLLSELFTSLLVIGLHNSSVIVSNDLLQPLLSLLEHLDKFNLIAPGAEREDNEDLSWPGIIGKFFFYFTPTHLG